MQELYEKAARSAYENCLALLEESRILADRSKFARAYALCVLGAEEFCKSFLYKGVSAGLVEERKIQKVLKLHPEKLGRFVHILMPHVILGLHANEIDEAIEHDKGEPDHANHIYPVVMDKMREDGIKWGPTIASLFATANETKLNGLYVDIASNKIVVPKEAIGRELYEQISWFLNTFLPGFEIILNEDDATFRRVAERLDPEFRYILNPRTD